MSVSMTTPSRQPHLLVALDREEDQEEERTVGGGVGGGGNNSVKVRTCEVHNKKTKVG